MCHFTAAFWRSGRHTQIIERGVHNNNRFSNTVKKIIFRLILADSFSVTASKAGLLSSQTSKTPALVHSVIGKQNFFCLN